MRVLSNLALAVLSGHTPCWPINVVASFLDPFNLSVANDVGFSSYMGARHGAVSSASPPAPVSCLKTHWAKQSVGLAWHRGSIMLSAEAGNVCGTASRFTGWGASQSFWGPEDFWIDIFTAVQCTLVGHIWHHVCNFLRLLCWDSHSMHSPNCCKAGWHAYPPVDRPVPSSAGGIARCSSCRNTSPSPLCTTSLVLVTGRDISWKFWVMGFCLHT